MPTGLGRHPPIEQEGYHARQDQNDGCKNLVPISVPIRHHANIHHAVECMCGMATVTREVFQQHLQKQHHGDFVTPLRPYLKCPLCDINMMALQNSNNIYLTTNHPPHYIYCGISKLDQRIACIASNQVS